MPVLERRHLAGKLARRQDADAPMPALPVTCPIRGLDMGHRLAAPVCRQAAAGPWPVLNLSDSLPSNTLFYQ